MTLTDNGLETHGDLYCGSVKKYLGDIQKYRYIINWPIIPETPPVPPGLINAVYQYIYIYIYMYLKFLYSAQMTSLDQARGQRQ